MSTPARDVQVGHLTLGNRRPLGVIAGPCVIEGGDFAARREFAFATARAIQAIVNRVGVPWIYKASFDKANRTSSDGFRGPGLEEGLRVLEAVRMEFGVPVVTDIHTPEQAEPVAAVVDMLQTPAFLCRQTDLIQAAARAGRPVNIKKGQFLAPADMARVVEKARATGNDRILVCERGFAFGYGDLVVDMRALEILGEAGAPVVFDATHSVQKPGGKGDSSGGERRFVAALARAAVAVGVAALFLETHPDPDRAPCDGPNMVPFGQLEALLRQLKRLDEVSKDA
ncbi:2-dehydro-3-deoxyphosphooctonate aldolase [Candidatus Magnetaquicoccaceae bacterium FCR-1]|uniref:2-dehydro-3-deoxyphosphooctonate aldolase n=1 Tax=Candidatus Magnetaquiglobus chichijimensis TaxID=3141448 RepID=A0ABQ0C614_9PROT